MTTSEILTLIGIMVTIFIAVLGWIGLLLRDIKDTFREVWAEIAGIKEGFDNLTRDTEHRLTSVETNQRTNIERVNELWKKCYGLFSKRKDDCEVK